MRGGFAPRGFFESPESHEIASSRVIVKPGKSTTKDTKGHKGIGTDHPLFRRKGKESVA